MKQRKFINEQIIARLRRQPPRTSVIDGPRAQGMRGGSLHPSRATGGFLAAVLFIVAGCTTVQPVHVSAFGQDVDTVKLQLDTAFAAVNEMATEDQIDRAVTLTTLKEDDVGVVLKREDIAKWANAFAAIDLMSRT